MREIGMPFRPDMAAALRNGTKTQHRVLIEPQPKWEEAPGEPHPGLWCGHYFRGYTGSPDNPIKDIGVDEVVCPWQVGDRIYVKEDWWHYKSQELEQAAFIGGTICLLEDGSPSQYLENKSFDPRHYAIWKRQDPRDMPSWAARTWLEVTGIEVQRIQDILEEDARAEGVSLLERIHPDQTLTTGDRFGDHPYRCAFAVVWESLYPGSWERNDWVWKLDLKLIEKGGAG